MVFSKNQRITLDTYVESIIDRANLEDLDHDLNFAANYYDDHGNTMGIINFRYYPDLKVTQRDVSEFTLEEVREIDSRLKEEVMKSVKAFGTKILSWDGTKKDSINGITALISEYQRKSIKGPGIFRVRLIRVLAGPRSFTMTISYHEQQAHLLKPITDRIIISLRQREQRSKGPPNTRVVLDQDFKKCILALENIELYIENSKTELSAYLAKSLTGTMWKKNDYKWEKIQADGKWEEEDLKICLNYGAERIAINLLLKAMNDTLPNNPSASLANCQAGLIITANDYEIKYGKKAAFEKGRQLGKKFARALVSVRYLYYEKYDALQVGGLMSRTKERAFKIYKAHMKKKQNEKKRNYSTLISECELVGMK
jgi:hypothetical protein